MMRQSSSRRLRLAQHAGVELPEVDGDDAAERQHQKRQPAEERHVQPVALQKPEARDHLILRLGHDLALAHDDLALDQHLGLHRFARLLAIGLGDLGVNEHVRANVAAHDLGVEVHQRDGIVAREQIAGDARDRRALLSLGQGGVERLAHFVRARGRDLRQRIVARAQQRVEHLRAQFHGSAAVERLERGLVRGIRVGVRFLQFGDAPKVAVERFEHDGVDAGIHALVAGFDGARRRFAQRAGRHRIFHILCGVDRLAGGWPTWMSY